MCNFNFKLIRWSFLFFGENFDTGRLEIVGIGALFNVTLHMLRVCKYCLGVVHEIVTKEGNTSSRVVSYVAPILC